MTQRRKSSSKRSKTIAAEPDSAYFLKLVMYLIVGSQWLRSESVPDWRVPIPLGLIIGLLFASHDHFAIDRKIEFAVLLVATFIAFWLPMGVIIQV